MYFIIRFIGEFWSICYRTPLVFAFDDEKFQEHWKQSRLLQNRDFDVPWTWTDRYAASSSYFPGDTDFNSSRVTGLLKFDPKLRDTVPVPSSGPVVTRSGWVWRSSRLFPHSSMELWFLWSELWSRSAPMTGSFPERRAGVFVRFLSLSRSLALSIALSVSYFLFHVPFLDSQQPLICPTLTRSFPRTRGRLSESASPTEGITVEKKAWKKMWSSAARKTAPSRISMIYTV